MDSLDSGVPEVVVYRGSTDYYASLKVVDSVECFCALLPVLINRPGVAGAVLQTASLVSQSVSDPFPPDLHNIINHKQ